MEEVNSPPHSMGSGQPHQHPVNHSRPFFYVQPPSQPYYMYQWHMNNPYSHYGFPGSGLHFGRPYMAPYPYMQYPGYVIPHAPMQPVDYRRVFNPHFPSAAGYDIRFRHHHHHQTHVRRETACSEAQTDPSDAVNKLIESLERLRTRGPVVEKELDSGIVSQGSGTFLTDGDSKRQERGVETEALPVKSSSSSSSSSLLSVSEGARSPKSIAPFAGLPGATCKAELNQRCFEELVPEEGWSEGPDGVLPLDSSSIHEENVTQKKEEEEDEEEEEEEEEEEDEFELHCVPEKLSSTHTDGQGSSGDANSQAAACGVKVQSESTQAQQPGATQDSEGPCEKTATRSRPSPESPAPPPPGWPDEEGAREPSGCQVSKATEKLPSDAAGGKDDVPEKPPAEPKDPPYRILRLPCDKATTAGLLQKDDPLWYVDSLSTLVPPHAYLSSFGNTAAYYYSYYPPAAQERQSVLSPSLDELSSRDEMFSTDLEDMDLISGHVYTGGRLAEAPRETRDSVGDEGKAKAGSFQKRCPVCPKMKKCSSCGSKLLKETKKCKARCAHGAHDYCAKEDTDEGAAEEDEEDEQDEDCDKMQRDAGETRTALPKRPLHSRRPLQPPPVRQPLKTKSKKGYCEQPGEPASQEDAPEYLRVTECCEEHRTLAKAERYKGQEPRSAQSRPHPDRQWRESSMASEQESWESCGVKPRPKSCKPYPSSRGEENPLRRSSCNTLVCQRSRRTDYNDNEEMESPQCHRGRGSTKRWHKTQN